MPPRTARLAAPIVVLAVVSGLAACGGSGAKEDDGPTARAKVEHAIAQRFAAQGVRLTGVACADGVKVEADAPLACTGRNPSGTKLVLRGTITAVKGDTVSFRVRAVGGVAEGRVIASQVLVLVRKRLGSDARSLTCPATIRLPTEPSVTCALVKADGRTYDVATVIGADSRVQLRVAARPR
ncbi:hypothetical protein AB0L40_19375 [Patulibacter sp. NPDC049589]|uniref:hypothetical protein n=1 Tax=Patulibacter sp. NPDC049589 TaxID=3154731 RepID=UPI003436E51F